MNVAEIFKDLDINVPEAVLYAIGVIFFGCWLLRTRFGTRALINSLPRRNNMLPFLPFIPFLIRLAILSVVTFAFEKFSHNLPEWQNILFNNLLYCVSAVLTAILIIYIVEHTFARRLIGFGFNFKTIHKDLGAALLNLFTIWPIVMAAIVITILIGKIFVNPDFEMKPHEELKVITSTPQLSVRLIIILTTTTIVPFFEEILFRGLFQSMFRTFLVKPWPAIAITSLIFAMVHSNPEHWPALFVLSMCIGYSYEKSGSLFRPIFIHSFFNAASLIGTLMSQ
jgi:membrane protease YdiL (CAAX protease family)